MKKIFKIFPVALGVVALASCSNDETFFGSEKAINGPELIVSTEAPFADDGVTRAAFETADGKYSVSWQAGDAFRVYDAALQKYDVFTAKVDGSTKKITLDGTSDVTTPDKAIFPGNNVQYAGWDKANDVVTATIKVPAAVNFLGQEATTVNGNETFAYVSNLPMWGNATKNGDNLEVSLKMLTAYTDITLYQSANVSAVRLVSVKTGKTQLEAEAAAAGDLDGDFPLAGYFDAQLKDGGQLVTTSGDLKNLEKSMIIGVNAIPNVDSVHVLIPVIPAQYPYLSVQAYYGSAWHEIKAYKNTNIKRNALLKNGLTLGQAPITARVKNLTELNTRLAYIATNYAGRTIDIYLDGEVATSEAAQTLTIPVLTADQTINIKGEIKNNVPNLPLKIEGGAAGKKLTLNVESGINGSENVKINTLGDLQLIGAITSTGSGANHGTIKVDGVGTTLTLGKGQFGAFSTGMIVEMNDNKTIVVDAGTGTVNTLNVKGTGTADIVSGTVTTFTNAAASTGAITVGTPNTAPTVGTLTTAGNAAVTVDAGANVTTLNANGGAAAVTINADAAVETLSTKSTNITINANVANVTLNATAAGTLALTDAKITTLTSNATATIAVTSTGKAAIVNYSKNNGKKDCTFASQLTAAANTQKVAASDINANGEIFTAAQLAAITTGKNYKLMADIDIYNKAWNTPSLNGNFNGNGKTISNIKQALFNAVSGGEIKNFTLNTVNIQENADNQGAVARTVSGTVTIKDVTVGGTVSTKTAENKGNVGGLVGSASGTLTLQDNQLVNTSVGGYKNVGGYIGVVTGGTINILTTKSNTDKQSDITFTYIGKSGKPAAADAGTFGNFIGSITGAANVTIGGTGNDANAGKDIAKFFNVTTKGIKDATAATALYYDENKNASSQPFLGMHQTLFGTYTFHYEIGRSTNLGSLLLYDSIVDDLGNPYTLTLSDINQY